MGRLIAGTVVVLFITGAVFVLGVIVGGSWNAGMQDEQGLDREAVQACLPAEDVDELEQCLQESS